MKRLLLGLLLVISPITFSTPSDIELKKSKDSSHAIVKPVEEDLNIVDEFQESDIDVAGYKIQFKGFFAAAGGITTAKQYNSTTGALVNPLYFGLRRQMTFESDSMAGIQLHAPVSDELEVVLQITARGRAIDNVTGKYDLNATWAYINYQFKDNLSVKVGRVLLPVFLLSQYIDVAYAYPWIKPPQEIYGSVSLPSSNGAIASWIMPVTDEWQLELSPFWVANLTQTPFVNGMEDLDLINFVGLGANISNGWIKMDVFYASGNLKLNGGNAISVPVSSTTSLSLPGVNVISSYLGAGLRAEKNNFLVLSEYAIRRMPGTYNRDTQSWYVLLGYQIKKIMPYVTYAETKSLKQDRLNILPPELQSIMSARLLKDQRSINAGIRYDIMKSVSLKVSVTHITPLKGTRGLFSDIPAQKSVNIYNAGLNLVF